MLSDRRAQTARRLGELRMAMRTLERQPGVMVVTSAENRRYLTGFTGSSGAAVVSEKEAIFLTDFRYVDQAKVECPGWEIVRHGPIMAGTVAETIRRLGEGRIGFERQLATFAWYEELASRLDGFELVPVGPVIEDIREVKEDGEVDLIREAAALTDKALEACLPLLRPGAVEKDVAAELEYKMTKLGADGSAFPTIVASGSRGALPHGRASAKAIEAGDFVTVDMGAMFEGYCADLTRTFGISHVTEEQERVYALVLEAQEKSLAAVAPGRAGKEVDSVARDIISAQGHGEHFGHGLGHAVGLAVHEDPRLSPTSDRVLKAGNVVTVEPGVYIADWGGVRIEDLVVVRQHGCEVLSKFPKRLMVL